MDKDKKIFGAIFIALGVLFLLVIIYFLFFYKLDKDEAQPVPAQKAAPRVQNTLPAETKKEEPKKIVNTGPKIVKKEFFEADLKTLAMAFTERFGSYSNQSDFGQLRDLKVFMSVKMQAWVDNYITVEISKHADKSIYYGITTKAVTAEVKKFDADKGEGEVSISTQRREATGTTNNISNFQQNIVLTYVKENGAWKADGALWAVK